MPSRPSRNRVLDELSRVAPTVYQRFQPDLEAVALPAGATLGPAPQPNEWIYFIESGIVSLVATARGGHSVGVALVGREGVAGIADALGQQRPPSRLVVHLPGHAFRVAKPVIREHIFSCTALHDLLMDQSQRLVHQLAQSALCNRFHSSVQRLSRWLLLTAERARTWRLELTHEFIAEAVGAPRSAVSEVAPRLRASKSIDYRRGVLTIKNPSRLHRLACECAEVLSLASDRGGEQWRPASAEPTAGAATAARPKRRGATP